MKISPGVYVRDPFGTCANEPAGFTYTVATCGLNMIPAGRLDPNAIALLNLYPLPTTNAVGSLFSNYANSPKLFEHANSFDTRMDINFNEKNQLFFRFSLVDDPQFIPGIFGGVADGGGFQQGTQTAIAEQSALGYTHTFSPTLINEVRAGLNYLHTSRYSPDANDLTNIPGQFGIQDVPQVALNGGLPAFGINGLSTLGSNAFLPSDEVTSTFQLTDSVTKIYGKHTFKMGFEWQHVKFSTLQPPWSRGEFDYNGDYTEVPTVDSGNTGRADFLLTPIATRTALAAGFPDYVGGASNVDLSNISLTDNGKNYYGGYFNDDWKISRKLTVNLGLRYDFFGLVFEHHSNQANFVPAPDSPTGSRCTSSPNGPNASNLSTSFLTLLATDGIAWMSRTLTALDSAIRRTPILPRAWVSPTRSPRSWLFAADSASSTTALKTAGFHPTLAKTIPSSSISTTVRQTTLPPSAQALRLRIVRPQVVSSRPASPFSRPGSLAIL